MYTCICIFVVYIFLLGLLHFADRPSKPLCSCHFVSAALGLVSAAVGGHEREETLVLPHFALTITVRDTERVKSIGLVSHAEAKE